MGKEQGQAGVHEHVAHLREKGAEKVGLGKASQQELFSCPPRQDVVREKGDSKEATESG